MMRHFFVWVLIAFFNASFALETPLQIPYSSGIERVISSGELRVAMYGGELPPFIVKNTQGAESGYDVLVAHVIADQLGVKLRLDTSAVTFNEAVKKVAQGKDDIAISNLTATPDRALSVSFTEPYYRMPQALIARHGFNFKKFDNSEEIISNKSLRIGVAAQSSYVYYAKLAFPNATILTYSTLDEGLENLSRQQYDLVFTDGLSAQNAVKENKALVLLKLGKMHVDPIAIGVNPSAPDLTAWLNIYLNSLDARITMQEFQKKVGLL